MGLAFALVSPGEGRPVRRRKRVDTMNECGPIPKERKPLCRKGGNGSERRPPGQAAQPQWSPPATQVLRRDP